MALPCCWVLKDSVAVKRPPSTFSYIKVLEIGESVSLPSDKSYAARCAASYLEVEYERTFSISSSTDGEMVVIKRLT